MKKKDEIKYKYEQWDKLKQQICDLNCELIDVYKFVYSDLAKSLEWRMPYYVQLDTLRKHHKEQLEKEKMKNFIKECMGEIKE